MSLVSKETLRKWETDPNHIIFKNFQYIYKNPLFDISEDIPRGISACIYWWRAMVIGLILMRFIIVPMGLTLKFVFKIWSFLTLSVFDNTLGIIDKKIRSKFNKKNSCKNFRGGGFLFLILITSVALLFLFSIGILLLATFAILLESGLLYSIETYYVAVSIILIPIFVAEKKLPWLLASIAVTGYFINPAYYLSLISFALSPTFILMIGYAILSFLLVYGVIKIDDWAMQVNPEYYKKRVLPYSCREWLYSAITKEFNYDEFVIMFKDLDRVQKEYYESDDINYCVFSQAMRNVFKNKYYYDAINNFISRVLIQNIDISKDEYMSHKNIRYLGCRTSEVIADQIRDISGEKYSYLNNSLFNSLKYFSMNIDQFIDMRQFRRDLRREYTSLMSSQSVIKSDIDRIQSSSLYGIINVAYNFHSNAKSFIIEAFTWIKIVIKAKKEKVCPYIQFEFMNDESEEENQEDNHE